MRVVYSIPTKAGHLNDKSARYAISKLTNQFAKTAHSITPPVNAETEDWASVNFMLVKSNNTGFIERFSGIKKDRNIVTSAAASCTDKKLEVFMGSGGMIALKAMIRSLRSSGRYDDKVEHQHDAIKRTPAQRNQEQHIPSSKYEISHSR